MAQADTAVLVMKFLLATKRPFVDAALTTLYAHQTADEQDSKQTSDHNGEGFNGTDAEFLSSLAEQVEKRRNWQAGARLSVKQYEWAHKKMQKYAAQLVRYSAPDKLAALVAKHEASAQAWHQAKMGALIETVAEKTAGAVVAETTPLAGYADEDVVMGNAFGAYERVQEERAFIQGMAWDCVRSL